MTTPGQQQQGHPPFTPAGPATVPRMTTPGQQQLTHAGPATNPLIPLPSHQQHAHVRHTADAGSPAPGHQQPARPGPPVGTRTHTPSHQQRPQGMHAAVNPGPHMQGHNQQQLWPSQPQPAHHPYPQAPYHQQPQPQPPPAQDLTPTLQAITATLGQVCDRLTSLEQSRIPPPSANPSAMPSAGTATEAILADEVRRRLAYLQESSTSSDSDDGIRAHHNKRGKSRKKRSGRGRTTEDFVVRDMPWPHHGVYKGPERRAATFDTLSVQEFVFGYIGNIDAAPDGDKAPMLQHLRELMHDAMYHPWASVRNYHGVVLGQMEQVVLTWTDRAVIQDLRAQYARTQSAPAQGQAHSVKPCFAYQRGQCDLPGDHPNAQGDKLHHCCSYCWRLKGKAFPHSEKDCRSKVKQVPKKRLNPQPPPTTVIAYALSPPATRSATPMRPIMTQDTMPREPNTACSPIQAPTVPSHPHPVCYDYVVDDSDSDSTDLEELQFYDACPPSNDRYSVTPSGRSLAALNSKCTDYPTLIDSCDMAAPNSTEVDNDTNNIFGIYSTVLASGIPNYRGARIPLSHKLNIVAWRQYYPNNPVLVDFLEFGFPLSYCLPYMPTPAFSNHSSAVHFPRDVDAYIKTELDHNAIQGPFLQPPFTPTFQTNALMTRPKPASDTRRVILDLSFPDQLSVNAGIPRDSYLSEYCKLSLPTPLDLRREILRHGKGCYLWSFDLSRGYRQLRTCPLDWPLLGIRWKGQYYFDTAVPFGVRWGAMYMQSTSAAVTDILQRDDIKSLAYIDDIAGVNTSHEDAQRCFNRARALLA